jgi:hypothetical protein
MHAALTIAEAATCGLMGLPEEFATSIKSGQDPKF